MPNWKSEMSGVDLQQILEQVGKKYRMTQHVPKHLEYLATRLMMYSDNDHLEYSYSDPQREQVALEVIDQTCRVTGIPVQQLLDWKRSAHRISLVRQIAMYIARERSRASFPILGKVFGRHHATVIYAHWRISQLIKESEVKQSTYVQALITKITDALAQGEQAA